MPSRELSFPVFDENNHVDEPKEALTKFLPAQDKKVIQYNLARLMGVRASV